MLKQIARDWDWQMRVTDDTTCRAVALWQQGLLDRLPPEIEHGVLACARDGEGWAILMRDYGGLMLPYARFSQADNAFLLDAMAALHAAFLEDAALTDPAFGLCQLRHVYSVFSPATGYQELGGVDEVPKRILEGWALLPSVVDADVAGVILGLLDDPEPLLNALSRFPQTLVHGDWRHANQGLCRGRPQQLILLDWQLASVAPPAVEMGRCLTTNTVLLPGNKEESIACYEQAMARRLGSRFDECWWRPQRELAILGGFLQDGWAVALKATTWHVGADAREHWQADLRWWQERVRIGAQWL